MTEFQAHGLARLHLARELFDHRVMKPVRAVVHGKTEVGLLCAPLHRCDHALIMVIEEANAATFEGRRLIKERLDRLRRRVSSMTREEKSRAVLPIDLIPRHRRCRVGTGDG